MNRITRITAGVVLAAVFTVPLMAGPKHHRNHHHHGNDGVRLAAQIVGLVKNAIAPAPVVVTRPAPVVIAPPPPRYRHHRPAPPPPPRHHRRNHRGRRFKY